jgi:UrcA family protein
MHCPSLTKYGLSLGIVAISLGFVAAASAQGGPYSYGPTESVIVVTPRMHADTTPLNGPLEKASLSQTVRYDDLNLLTRRGTSALRWRVWRTAQEVCDRLAEAYPVHQMTTEKPCERTAYENAMVQANGAISKARVSYRLGY